MSESRSGAVDVRDMLCAQALALVARAVKRLRVGQGTEVRYNSEDVRRDVVTWANERGHGVREHPTSIVSIERRQ